MSENELAPRTIGRKTIITIIGAIATAIVFGIGSWAYGAYKESVVKAGVTKTLEMYASDINSNTFDATRYFASSVPVFFEDKDRTPRLINIFWQDQFLKVFSGYQARFDFSTLEVTCGEQEHCASILLHSDYFNNKKQKEVIDELSRYDLKFDKKFRIVELKQVVY